MGIPMSDVRAFGAAVDGLVSWLRRQTPTQLSSSTITALDRLAGEGPLRVSDLARREAMTQPGVTLLVNRLSDAGLAERVPDPTDGRAALVRITDSGRAVLAERHDLRAEILRARLAQLDDTDQRLLVAAVPALERLLEAELSPTTPSTDPTGASSRKRS
jgi:DNA-binding MarR family transcriptional regulator